MERVERQQPEYDIPRWIKTEKIQQCQWKVCCKDRTTPQATPGSQSSWHGAARSRKLWCTIPAAPWPRRLGPTSPLFSFSQWKPVEIVLATIFWTMDTTPKRVLRTGCRALFSLLVIWIFWIFPVHPLSLQLWVNHLFLHPWTSTGGWHWFFYTPIPIFLATPYCNHHGQKPRELKRTGRGVTSMWSSSSIDGSNAGARRRGSWIGDTRAHWWIRTLGDIASKLSHIVPTA